MKSKEEKTGAFLGNPDGVVKSKPLTREMLERRIYGLCNNLSDYKLQNEFFARFYLKAFPEKLSAYIEYGGFDDGYCSEWITRFLSGTPSVYMDGNTLRAYFEVCIEWNNSKLRVVREE